LRVVSRDDSVREQEQRSAGIGDGGDTLRDRGAGADGVARTGEAPEATRVVDGGVGDAAGILGGVDVAEVVAARCALFQIGGEEGGGEAGFGVGEEGPGLVWLDGVDGAEGETEEAVALVSGEGGADG